MRLNLYRSGGTMRYDDQGNAIWYVVDESAPGADKYTPVHHGTIVECAKYIQESEQAEQREQEWVEASSHPSYHSNVEGN